MTPAPARDTRARLMRAAEHLFARNGIGATTIVDINRMARQRNPSAVHYHFGSKERLVEAILLSHQQVVDVEAGRRLDDLASSSDDVAVRDLVEAMVRPMCAELETESGRDFLRIVPQFLAALDANLRRGVMRPATEKSRQLLDLLDQRMQHLPQPVRRERLVAYTLVLTSILADRAADLERGGPELLAPDQFLAHILDLLEAVVCAPSTVPVKATARR